MALQDDYMLGQAEDMRKMIASSRNLSQQIEHKSDVLIEAVAAAKDNVKDAGHKTQKNINSIAAMQKNTQPDIAGLPLVDTKKAGKRKILF